MEIFLIYLMMYFEMILEKVDCVFVINKWWKEIVFLDLLFELVNKFYDLMIFLELRDKYLIDLWKEEFYKLCEKLWS